MKTSFIAALYTLDSHIFVLTIGQMMMCNVKRGVVMNPQRFITKHPQHDRAYKGLSALYLDFMACNFNVLI